jgi:hypothetical protein
MRLANSAPNANAMTSAAMAFSPMNLLMPSMPLSSLTPHACDITCVCHGTLCVNPTLSQSPLPRGRPGTVPAGIATSTHTLESTP